MDKSFLIGKMDLVLWCKDLCQRWTLFSHKKRSDSLETNG